MTDLDDSPPWDVAPAAGQRFTTLSRAKLAHSGLDEDYARAHGVTPVNSIDDLPSDVTWSQYLCPVPGMLFHWENPVTGELVPQYRPDHPVTYLDGESGPKYMFPEGRHQGLGLLTRSEVPNARIAIVEGTLQGLSFARYAPADVTVYAIAGCWGWSRKSADEETSTPVPEMSVVDGCDVLIFVDADAGTNSDVWDGATELARACTTYGASMVGFGRVPVRGTNGVDDFLGAVDEAKRSGVVERLMEQIEQKPASRKPPAKRKKLGGDPSKQDLPPTDDTFLGTTWADEHLDEFRVVSTDKAWISYRDGRWSVEGAELQVGHSLLEFMTEASRPLQTAMTRVKGVDPEEHEKYRRAVDAILSSRKRQAVASSAMVYRPVHVRRDELDQHPNLWCAANKVIDLSTGEVYDHDPRMLLTTGSDVEHNPDARCERFDQFLIDVLPDNDVRDFVMQVFGMAMLGAVRDHVLPVFIGEGRNGKGTLIRIMLRVFGSHARVINPKALIKRKFDAHAEEIAQLAGKRLAVAEETGQGAVWDVARVNEWTGGNRLSGRFMHGNSFDFDPSHTLVMATNHRPSVGQGEKAFWDRYKEVPFEVSFYGREDYTLEPGIIAEELPGVLNRLLEASGRYHGAGRLLVPNAVDVATSDARVDADNLARFCAEHLVVTNDETDRIVNAELYQTVDKWWSQNVRGEIVPSSRTFPKEMRSALGFPATMDNPRKLGQGGSVRRTWMGVRWLDEAGFEALIKPLPQASAESAVIGSMILPNLSTHGRGVEDRSEGTADVQDHTADDTADVVDHETSVSTGPGTDTDDTADTAAKVVMGNVSERNEKKARSTEEVTHIPSSESSAKEAHRQYRQIGSIETPLSGVVTFDLETLSAELQHDHPKPLEFVRIGAVSTDAGPELARDPKIIIDRTLSSQWVVGSNLIHYDLPVLARVDPRVDVLALAREGRVLDTMVTESVLNPIEADLTTNAVGKAQKHFKLDKACARYDIEGKTLDLDAFCKKNYGGDYSLIPWDTDTELQDYVRGDVSATERLKTVLVSMLARAPKALKSYVFREHRVHAIASSMSVSGFTVDQNLLQHHYWTSAGQKSWMTQQLVKAHGIPTVKADGKPADSPAATKEGKAALVRAFESLGVPERLLPRTAKGAISFSGDPLNEFAERCASVGHPHAEAIGELCEAIANLAGIRTVYNTTLEHLRSDGRVHPSVATFQASGRWSVTKPGLTVFGKRGIGRNGRPRVEERGIFTAQDHNHVLMPIDLSQIDARAIAVHSQDHAYLDLFGLNPVTGRPLDAHELVARMVWGDAVYDSNSKHYREQVKQITHGVPYGMGVPKLAANAKVTIEVAQRVVDTMNERFPRLQVWKQEIRDIAAVPGAYLDNGFGRLMRPDHPRAYTQGPALMGQGTARDLMMQCLINIDDRDPRVTRMLRAQIHDEAIFEFPKADAEELRQFVQSCFNFEWAPPNMSRPVQVSAEAGHFGFRWSECY